MLFKKNIFVYFHPYKYILRDKIINNSYTYAVSVMPILLYSNSLLVSISPKRFGHFQANAGPDEIPDVVTKPFSIQVTTINSRVKNV